MDLKTGDFDPVAQSPAPAPAAAAAPPAVQPLPGGTPGEPAPVSPVSAVLPAPSAQGQDFDPVDAKQPPVYIPSVVRDGLFPVQDMAALKAMPSDQAFDTAVRLNSGDIRWPLEYFKGLNPDVVAKVQQLAQNNNTTFDVANTSKQDLENIETAKSIFTALSAKDANGNPVYPATTAWLKDPVHMGMAHDDVAALTEIEDGVKQRQQIGESSAYQTFRGIAGNLTSSMGGLFRVPAQMTDFIRGVLNRPPPDMTDGPVFIPKNPTPVAPLTPLPSWLSDFGGLAPALEKSGEAFMPVSEEGRTPLSDIEQGHIAGAIQSGSASLASAIPGLIVGLLDPDAGLVEMAASSGGETYGRDVKAGKPGDAAANDGLISEAANLFFGKYFGHISNLERVQQIFASAPARESIAALTGRLATQATISGFKGAGAQVGITGAQDIGDYETGNPHALDNEKQNLLNAALLGFTADAAITTPLAAMDGYARVRQQQNGQAWWDNFTGAVDASKMRQRDPDALADQITQSAVAAGQPTTVGVDGEKLTTFFQGNSDGLADFAKDMGVTPQDITDAANTGGEVALPIGPYAAKYGGSPLDAAIHQDLRFTPGGLSANEVQDEAARVQGMAQSIQDELAKTASGQGMKLPDQIATMRDTMMRSKEEGGAGYTAEQADSQISVLLAGLKNLSAQRGESVEQTVNRLGLALRVGDIEQGPHSVLIKNQNGIDNPNGEDQLTSNGQTTGNERSGEPGAAAPGLHDIPGELSGAEARHAEAGEGVQSAPSAGERQEAARRHLNDFLAGLPPEVRHIIEPGAISTHEELSALSPEELQKLISIQRVPYPVKGLEAAKLASGEIHLITAWDDAHFSQEGDHVRKTFFKHVLNAHETDIGHLDDFEQKHPIVDPTGETNKHFDYSGADKELVTQPVKNISNKLTEAQLAHAAYPKTEAMTKLGIKSPIEKGDLDKLDQEFGKDNWLIKPYHPDEAASGKGVIFAETMRKVFDGGEAVYNLGDNPHGADHVVLTKDNIQDVVVPLFYMAQSKLDVAGATKELREKGFTILKGEKRVHLVTDLNGNAHPVLGATFRRSIEEGDNGLKIHSYDTPETLASEETAKRGIEQYPLEERQGSSFGPDVAPLKSGDHALVESNPATVSEQVDPLTGVELSNSGSGAYDYAQYQDAHVSAIRGELPLHVRFAREQMRTLAGLPEDTDLKNISSAAPDVRFQNNRGAVSFADGKTIIHLFKTADLSTFLHETGHVLFREMQGLVDQGLANDQTKADLQTLIDFAGGTLDRAGEEKIMSAFEAYLREGKAPSIDLAGPFARIRTWLTNVYRSIATLGAQPTDAIRQVFDRMLASEEDIADAQEYYTRTGQVLDLIKGDDAAKEAVRQKLVKANQSALDKQTSAYLKSYLKAIGGMSAIREAAKDEVEKQPVYRAIDHAREGKIDEASIEAAMGKDGLKYFKERYPSLVKAGGEHSLESLAAEFNFESPETLADNLVSAVPKNEAIKNYSQRLVLGKEDELRDEITKRGATPADGVMHTNASLTYLIAETQLMAKQLEGRNGPKVRLDERVYRDAAVQAIAGMSVKRAVRHDLFAKAEARLGRQVLDFAKKGKWEDALQARQKQMAQHAMVQEAINARDERTAIERRFSKTKLDSKLKNVEHAFLDPIRQILFRYELSDVPPSAPYDLTQLAGIDPALFSLMPTWLVRGENAGDYRNLTWGQLQDVDGAVRSLMAFGNDSMKSLRADEEKTVGEFVKASTGLMSELKDKPTVQRGAWYRPALEVADWLKSHTAMTQFTARIADNFTGERIGQDGPLTRLYMRMTRAELDQGKMGQKVLHDSKEAWTTLRDAAERIHAEYGGKKYFDIPELPLPEAMRKAGRGNWTAEMLTSFMLNTGNVGNKTALKNAYNYDDNHIAKVASHFNKNELEAIQKIWDVTDSLYDPLNKAHYDVYNRTIPKVEGESQVLQARDGDMVNLEGGYYPLIFDHEINDRAGAQNEEDLLKNKTQAVFRASKPEDGMTQSRVIGHSLPPYLSLDVWGGHIGDTTRYINYAAVVRDWNRITKDPNWKSTFTSKFGNRQYKVLRDWLQYQAVPRRHPTSEVMRGVDAMADWVRARSTTAILGWKTATGLMWRTSLINSAVELGGWKYVAEGYRFLGTKGLGTSTLGLTNTEGWAKIIKMSDFMATREKTLDREIRDALEHLKPGSKEYGIPGTNKKFSMQDVRDFAFVWAQMNDRAICAPVWAGAYQKYLMERADPAHSQEETNARAVAYADTVVQNTQPSALKAELSSMQRTEGWLRFTTAFMTWGMKYGNRVFYQNKAWAEGAITNKEYMFHIVHEVLAEPWARLLLKSAFIGSAPLWWQYPMANIENLLQWAPGLSSLASMAEYGISTDSVVPASEVLKRANNLRTDVKSKNFDPVHFAWDMGRMTEFLLGVPALNVVKDILNAHATINGDKTQPYK